MTINLLDNRYGRNGHIIYTGDALDRASAFDDVEGEGNASESTHVEPGELDSLRRDLSCIAGKSLRYLAKENPSLLIFPSSLQETSDRIADQMIVGMKSGKTTFVLTAVT